MDYFTSDTHFSHTNIIKYCNRPFKSVEEMDEVLIANWNSVVKKTDQVFHLGDFGYNYKIAQRLNGHKHLIWGNHDRKLRNNQNFINEFEWTKDLAQIVSHGQEIVLLSLRNAYLE